MIIALSKVLHIKNCVATQKVMEYMMNNKKV